LETLHLFKPKRKFNMVERDGGGRQADVEAEVDVADLREHEIRSGSAVDLVDLLAAKARSRDGTVGKGVG
jgi:hypothetical protein